MILSASRRTDIPCCYAPWFMNRIREGFALVRNPMNPHRVSRVDLNPRAIDCIVFWTKDCSGIMPYIRELEERGYSFCFQFTLSPYGKSLEPGLMDKEEIIKSFQQLSAAIGPKRVLWRYDPILYSDGIDISYHKNEFKRLCARLAPYTSQVTLSLVDMYKKIKSPLIQPVLQEDEEELWDFLGQTATAYGITPKSCCEKPKSPLIKRGACIDKSILEEICGYSLSLKPDKGQRPDCGCVQSVDIGAYYSCNNGCLYCYAGQLRAVHDENSPMLLGSPGPSDLISPRTL